MTTVEMGTAAWYSDDRLRLPFPDRWHVAVHRPVLDEPLSDEAIAALFAGAGGRRLAEMASHRTRPVVLVDDLTRPTPAARVLPPLLAVLTSNPDAHVTVLVAGGSHAGPSAAALVKKIGSLPARCRVVVHDYRAAAVPVGVTRFGTRVDVDPVVANADLVVGLGGIYPQHSTGFGGGSKIVLGAMAERSIVALHYGHRGARGTYDIDNDFRHDLDEAAKLAGLAFSISVFVDDSRRPVRILMGPAEEYYADAVEWARAAYRADLPGAADVVVSNAYPMDVSLTFMRSKGLSPLHHARPGASRVVVASCPEGTGHHGIYPFLDKPRFYRERHVLRLLRARRRELLAIASRRVRSMLGRSGATRDTTQPHPVALFVPPPWGQDLPDLIPGMRVHRSWDSVLAQVAAEQGHGVLRADVYTCAPLQVLASP